jgi:hypothetical protein
VRKDGTVRWSQPLSKSWQYVKKILKIERQDVSLYSSRHSMAELLDNDAIAQRTRDRILGHAGDARRRAALITSLEPPVIKAAREILLAAKERAERGELIALKTHQSSR